MALIELSRPTKRNALDLPTVKALTDIFTLSPPPTRRIYLLYGLGSVFSAGADTHYLDPASSKSRAMFAAFDDLYHRMDDQSLPIGCWINGPAVGAGAILTAFCDFRLVSSASWLAIPGTSYGLALSPWIVDVVARELGQSVARLLLLGNSRVAAQSLLSSGFALGSAETSEEAARVIRGLGQHAPLAMKAHRRALQHKDHLAAELFKEVAQSADLREGFAASREGRQPLFEGR